MPEYEIRRRKKKKLVKHPVVTTLLGATAGSAYGATSNIMQFEEFTLPITGVLAFIYATHMAYLSTQGKTYKTARLKKHDKILMSLLFLGSYGILSGILNYFNIGQHIYTKMTAGALLGASSTYFAKQV